ncbi:MAG TPA: sensor histidine kinase [Bryobacteraceae bacterium]|jgi:signal transduction histidine kinase
MIPHVWRVSLALVRVALALVFLVIYFISVQSILSIPGLVLVAYFIASIVVVASSATNWFPVHRGWPALGTLLGDSFISLFWVAIYSGAIGSPEIWFWVSAASWIFVIAHAELTQNVWIVAALTGVGLTLLFLIPSSSSTNLTAVVLGAGALAIVWSFQRKYYEKRLSMAARQNVLLRDDSQRARESERQRIAADFHDGPLQAFIGFLMRLELLRKLIVKDTDTAMSELKQLQDIAKKQVNELRSFVRSMRPVEVEGSSFAASLSRLVEQFQKDTGVNATFMSGDYEEPGETETSLELLQIVRESLNNVQKHSRATRVLVSVSRHGDGLEVTVDDNGAGFPFSGLYTIDEMDMMRLGPVSIKRRVRVLGGDLTIDSRPGEGASLKVRTAS